MKGGEEGVFKRQKRLIITNKGILAMLEYEIYQAQQALQDPVDAKLAQEWCEAAMKHVKMLMGQP